MAKYNDVPPAVRRILSSRDEVEYHLMRENRTLQQEFILILKKESKLPKRLRDFIIQYYDEKDKNDQANENNTATEGHP